MAKPKTFDSLTPEKRLDLAKSKTGQLANAMAAHIHLHESNQILSYKGTIVDQIQGHRNAAVGYNIAQSGLFSFELIRLCSFWDKAGPDRISIPTVIELIDHPEVKAKVDGEVRKAYGDLESLLRGNEASPIQTADTEERVHFIRSPDWSGRITKARADFANAMSEARTLEQSDLLRGIKRHRDYRLAHQLEMIEGGPHETKARKVKYGDEKQLLHHTIDILDTLYVNLRQATYVWEICYQDAQQAAEGLWNRLRFEP